MNLTHARLLQVILMFVNPRDLIFVAIEDILRSAAGSALETSEFVVRLLFLNVFLHVGYYVYGIGGEDIHEVISYRAMRCLDFSLPGGSSIVFGG